MVDAKRAAAHTPRDVDTLIEVFTTSLIDAEADGLFAA